MYIKDRGNIKWNSLLLVEHRKRLRKLKQKEDEIDKPELEEQEKKRLDYILKEARTTGSLLRVGYYYRQRIRWIKGRVKKYHTTPGAEKIIFYNPDSKSEYELVPGDIVELEKLNS